MRCAFQTSQQKKTRGPCNLWRLEFCFLMLFFIDVSANSFWKFSRISLTFVTFGAFWASFETSKMVALTLTTLLVSLAFPVVNGYVRMATAVGGDVVLGAGNLTQGGKVGLYTVLLQVGCCAQWKKKRPPKKGAPGNGCSKDCFGMKSCPVRWGF